jgi:hypothetical protein
MTIPFYCAVSFLLFLLFLFFYLFSYSYSRNFSILLPFVGFGKIVFTISAFFTFTFLFSTGKQYQLVFPFFCHAFISTIRMNFLFFITPFSEHRFLLHIFIWSFFGR